MLKLVVELIKSLEGLYNHYKEPAKGTFEHLDWATINYNCKDMIKRIKKLLNKLGRVEDVKYINNLVYLVKVARKSDVKLEFHKAINKMEIQAIEVYADNQLLTVEDINKIAENAKQRCNIQ